MRGRCGALWTLAALGAAGLTGCSHETSGSNQPCEVDSDCPGGEICIREVCALGDRRPDCDGGACGGDNLATDAEAGDAATPADAATPGDAAGSETAGPDTLPPAEGGLLTVGEP